MKDAPGTLWTIAAGSQQPFVFRVSKYAAWPTVGVTNYEVWEGGVGFLTPAILRYGKAHAVLDNDHDG